MQLKFKKIIVAVPTLILIKQILDIWSREAIAHKWNIRWICVCSDKTLRSFKQEDAPMSLQDLGVKVETKPDGTKEEVEHKDERSSKTTDMTAMIGTIFLWMF